MIFDKYKMFRVELCALFCICLIKISQISCDEYKTVETNDGSVRGLRTTTIWSNVDYYAYKGIPYAEKPIGPLRFKAPQPVTSWKPKQLDAFEFKSSCWQLVNYPPQVTLRSEDCLYLNIYTPYDVRPSERLPVLFYIHGCSNIYSRDDIHDFYGPDFIIEKNTLLVTINYRVGAFGFLSLNTTEYSGNVGLKDQQLALKWIHDNIGLFNGDNRKITIFGHDEGAAAVYFHMLSPESRKYFRNAIPIGGSAFSPWAMNTNNDHYDFAIEMAKNLSESSENVNELIETLVSAPEKDIVAYTRYDYTPKTKVHFKPIVERTDAYQPFMTQTPQQIYENANFSVDAMFELVEMREFLYSTTATGIEKRMRSIIADLSDNYPEIWSTVKQFYFGNGDIYTGPFGNYFYDINFAYPVYKAAKIDAQKTNGKVFYLRFSVDGFGVIVGLRLVVTDKIPSKHELCNIFSCKYFRREYEDKFNKTNGNESTDGFRTIDRITDLITKFAKVERDEYETNHGLGFPSIRDDVFNYGNLTNDVLKADVNPDVTQNDFWENIERRWKNASIMTLY